MITDFDNYFCSPNGFHTHDLPHHTSQEVFEECMNVPASGFVDGRIQGEVCDTVGLRSCRSMLISPSYFLLRVYLKKSTPVVLPTW